MHARHGGLYGFQNTDIGVAGVFGMNAALHADLGAAPLPGFLRAALDLLVGKVVGPPAQVLRQLALGEGAELALEIADVGVVDVAVDDEADQIAVDLRPQPVGGPHHGGEVPASCLEQPHHFGFLQAFAVARLAQNGGQVRGGAQGSRNSGVQRGCRGGLARQGGYALQILLRRIGRLARRPSIRAREAVGIDQFQKPLMQFRCHPSCAVLCVCGIEGQAFVQLLAG